MDLHRSPITTIRPAAWRRGLAVLAGSLLVLGVACSSDPDDAKGDKGDKGATTTTTAPEGDGTTRTTRPPIDPEEVEGGEEAYVDALIGLIEQTSDPDAPTNEEDANCLAPKWVAIIGVEGFAEAGVAPEDFGEVDGGLEQLGLDEATATEMTDAFADCDIDVRELVVRLFKASYPSMGEDIQACVERAITEEVARTVFIANIIGEQPPAEATEEVQRCVTPPGEAPPGATTTVPG